MFEGLRGRESEETEGVRQMSLTLDLCHSDSCSFFIPSLHTQKLTHWLTCPTFLHFSSSDWLGVSSHLGVYMAGWPLKCTVPVQVCFRWIKPNTTSHICLLPPPPPSLSPNLLRSLAKLLHAFSASFLTRPPPLNPATQASSLHTLLSTHTTPPPLLRLTNVYVFIFFKGNPLCTVYFQGARFHLF